MKISIKRLREIIIEEVIKEKLNEAKIAQADADFICFKKLTS